MSDHGELAAMRALVSPRSVAVVGVSDDEASPPTRVVRALRRGNPALTIHVVNPRHQSLLGQQCYPSVGAIPEIPDLVIVGIRASGVVAMMDDASAAGVRNFVVLSAGFAEVGGEGHGHQRDLHRLVQDRGLYVLGPNTVGFVNFLDGCYCSFNASIVEGDARVGNVALVSQSGAVAGAMHILASQRGFGLAFMGSTGNEGGVQACELGSYLLGDDRVAVLGLHLEAVRNRDHVVALARRSAELGKPVVVLRSGYSSVGSATVRSHTGALARPSRVTRALMESYGFVQVDTPEELVLACELLAHARRITGRRIAVLSGSGGMAAIIADRADQHGLELPNLGPVATAALREVLPSYAHLGNPVDLTPTPFYTPGAIDRCVAAAGCDPNVDGVIVYVQASGTWSGTVAAEIVRGAGEAVAGTVALWLGVTEDDRRTLDEGGVAVFDQIDLPLRALSRAGGWSPRGDAGIVPVVDPLVDVGAASSLLDGAPPGPLDEADAKSLLIAAGVPHVVRPGVVRTDADLIAVSQHARFPVAVKILSRSIAHKSAVGGVVLNVCSPADLARARDQVLDACRQLDHQGVLVESMAPAGIEVFIGAAWDPELGPVALVGRGGTGVERADDLAVAPAPLDESAATKLLERTDFGASLRDRDADVAALARVIGKITSLFVALDGRVREMDVNPVIVHPKGQGVSIVDCFVVTEPATTRS